MDEEISMVLMLIIQMGIEDISDRRMSLIEKSQRIAREEIEKANGGGGDLDTNIEKKVKEKDNA